MYTTCEVLSIEVWEWGFGFGKDLQDLDVLPYGCQVDGCVAFAVGRVGGGTSFQQHLNHLRLLCDHCKVQWSLQQTDAMILYYYYYYYY